MLVKYILFLKVMVKNACPSLQINDILLNSVKLTWATLASPNSVVFSCVILLLIVTILLYCTWFWKKVGGESELELQHVAKDVGDNDVKKNVIKYHEDRKFLTLPDKF